MAIENLRYFVLAQQPDLAEIEPTEGETVRLKVEKMHPEEGTPTIEEAIVKAEFVSRHSFSREVIGRGHTLSMGDDLPCQAVYDVERTYPVDNRIGTLVFKRESHS